MKRFAFAVLACLAFTSSFAFSHHAVVNVDGELNNEQIAQLQLKASDLVKENQKAKEQAVVPVTPPVSKVKEWVDVGTAIGSGLASSAKELGVAANDFANTRVGKFTMLLIAWHFVGAQFVHIAFGLVWLLILIPVWLYLYRRTWNNTTITTFESGKGPDGAKRIVDKRTRHENEVGDGTAFMLWVSFMLILLVGVVSVFTF